MIKMPNKAPAIDFIFKTIKKHVVFLWISEIGNAANRGYGAPEMTRTDDDNRVKQVAVGVGILAVLALIVCGSLVGWRYLPGLFGEWIGMMAGVMTTPFFLETSFVIIGLTVVLAINHWRQKRAGDEFMYLEQIEGADVPAGLPGHAKWTVYRAEPLEGEIPPLQAQAEGALAIGDHEAATECIAAMSEAELKRPETLRLRLELATATGRQDLVDRLESELRMVKAETL